MHTIKVSLCPSHLRYFDLPRLEKIFEIKYIHHLQFEDSYCEEFIRDRCRKAFKKEKIDSLALWLGTYHAKDLDRTSIPDVTLKWIDPKIGYGIFSNTSFKKWDYIGEYAGLLKRKNFRFPNVNDYCFMYPRSFKFQRKSFTIDSEKYGNYTRFINHSDFPNAETICVFHEGIFRVLIRACKPIYPGEEITYDYGEYYWQRRTKLDQSHFPSQNLWLHQSAI